MYGMTCSARARGKPAKTNAGGSETGIRPAMSDALRGLLDGVRARLPSRPRRAVDHGAQATDPADRLRRIRNGKVGPPGYALGSMMADMFHVRGYTAWQ